MESLLDVLNSLDQDQAVVMLFAALLVVCVGAACLSLLVRSLGKWGRVAVFVLVAVVVIVWRVAR